MFVLLGGMALVTLLIMAAMGMVSFTPNGPKPGEVQAVDAAAYVQQEEANMDFPVVLPQVPEGWIPNAARRSSFGDHPAPTIGWVTDDDLYAQLTQTAAPADAIVRSGDVAYQPMDTVEIDGVSFTRYAAEGERPLWIGDLGAVRVVVTGSTDEGRLTELAAAAVRAQQTP